MIGFCGVVGEDATTVERVADAFRSERLDWTAPGETETVHDDDLGLFVSTHAHPPDAVGQHESIEGQSGSSDVDIWVLGEVLGRCGEHYTTRPSSMDDAEYVARSLDEHGPSVVGELNGHFAGVAYDRSAGEVTVFTDRIGSWPVFYAQPADGTTVFSTQLQALAAHPALDVSVDVSYLREYFTYRRTFGVQTPLEGVERVPPGSTMTIDAKDGTIETTRHWEPVHRPTNESFESFVTRFTDAMVDAVTDGIDPSLDCGVLLSGGVDSRLILAALEGPATAFYIGDPDHREARIAERVADSAGCALRVLDDSRFDELALERNAPLSNFDGYYFQGYVSPFAEEITSEVDVLFSGLYADTLFKGRSIPQRSLALDPVGTLHVPVETPVSTIDDVVDHWSSEGNRTDQRAPEYVADHERSGRHPLRDNVGLAGPRPVHHGVDYRSIRELLLCSPFVPLSNDTELVFPNSLRQLRPCRLPYLDARLIDLHLSMPVRYQLRRNVVARALERLAPDLASIPHEPTGAPLDEPFLVQYAVEQGAALWRKFAASDDEASIGPQRDHASFVRNDPFVERQLLDNEHLVRALPMLDWDGVRSVYRDHCAGGDRTSELLTLVTFLSMPVTASLAADGRDPVVSHGVRRERAAGSR